MGLVVLIERPGWRLASDSKVIEPDEACVIEEAAQLMRGAETYARRILGSSKKVFDAKADEGYREGERHALHDVARRLAELEAARTSLLEVLKPSLIDLLLDALGRLAQGVERERFYASALNALEGAWRAAGWARLRVHPDDVAAARTALAALTNEGGSPLHLQVVADETVGPQGCRFESDLGSADAGLPAQLAVLREAFDAGLSAWAVDEPMPVAEPAASPVAAQAAP
jgi:type III secretion protein L